MLDIPLITPRNVPFFSPSLVPEACTDAGQTQLDLKRGHFENVMTFWSRTKAKRNALRWRRISIVFLLLRSHSFVYSIEIYTKVARNTYTNAIFFLSIQSSRRMFMAARRSCAPTVITWRRQCLNRLFSFTHAQRMVFRTSSCSSTHVWFQYND